MSNYLVCPAVACPGQWSVVLPDPPGRDLALNDLGEWAAPEVAALVGHLDEVDHYPLPVMALIVVQGPDDEFTVAQWAAHSGRVLESLTPRLAQLAAALTPPPPNPAGDLPSGTMCPVCPHPAWAHIPRGMPHTELVVLTCIGLVQSLPCQCGRRRVAS